jgi:hypothetical protein
VNPHVGAHVRARRREQIRGDLGRASNRRRGAGTYPFAFDFDLRDGTLYIRWVLGRVRWAGLTGAVLIASFAVRAASGDEPPVPPVSSMPRMRQVWAAEGLTTDAHAPLRGGVMFAWTAREKTRELVAIDASSGKERWRTPIADGPEPGIAFADPLVILHSPDGTLAAIDFASGRQRWKRKVCKLLRLDSRGHLAAGTCEESPPDPPSPGAPRIVHRAVVAFDLRTGRKLWRLPSDSALDVRVGTRWVYVATGAIASTVHVLEPSSGKERRKIEFARYIGQMGPEVGGDDLKPRPEPSPPGPEMAIERSLDGQTLVKLPQQYAPPTYLVAPPRVLQLTVKYGGVLVFRTEAGLVAYSVLDPLAPEAIALSPAERVRAILGRRSDWPRHYLRSGPIGEKKMDELRAVPGHDKELAALAADTTSPLHDAAVDAAVALAIPGWVSIALAELDRPLTKPLYTGPDLRASFATTAKHPGLDGRVTWAYEEKLWQRADLVLTLAKTDDPLAADKLAPLLFATAPPSGLGADDWKVWGKWDERGGYGRASWDMETSYQRWLYQASWVTVPHSECLASASGRPESHAAIYRMLARRGRPADLAALRRLDGESASPGGWARICARDDALVEKNPVRLPWASWGLCRGLDVGEYRVTQAEAVWVRRRQPDGSLGPPAWAHDPGGDRVFLHRVQSVELRAGRIVLHGVSWSPQGPAPLEAEIDPAEALADRDRDGLSDKTEAAFGTDPARADTDGDGVPDGRDPAPLAAAPRTDAGRAEVEALRYLTRFVIGGPLFVQAAEEVWGDPAGAGGVVLHRRGGAGMDDPRLCAGAIAISSLEVKGNEAEMVVELPGHRSYGHTLTIRRVGGEWRVVADE